jgi:hypothetical protein
MGLQPRQYAARTLDMLCALTVIGLLGAISAAQGPPLLQPHHLTYLGAFRLPTGTYGHVPPDAGPHSFDLAPAYGLAFHPPDGLFLASKENLLNVAEVGIPAPGTGPIAGLPVATVRQGFRDPSDGRFANLGINRIGGLLVAGDRLLFTSYIFYDAENTQRLSHFSRSLDLQATGTVQGPFGSSTTATAGLLNGYMASVPTAWQAALGGTFLTGNCCLSIIGRTSWGPGVFAVSAIGANYPAQPLVFYTMEHPTLGAGTPTTSGALFNLADTIHGVVMPEGFRSVLFIGNHGEGAWCYGNGTSDPKLDHVRGPDGEIYCYDPVNGAKGQHAYPYTHFVWAYDVNDLAAVKAGTKQPWQVVPYATWRLSLPYGVNELAGVAYDASRQRLYVIEKGLEPVGCCTFLPVVHVLQVDPTGVSVPTNARVLQ